MLLRVIIFQLLLEELKRLNLVGMIVLRNSNMKHDHGMFYGITIVVPEKVILLISVELLEQDIIKLLGILSESQTEYV